jgi:hypothetical protein
LTATEETERGTRKDKEVEEEVQVQVSESLLLSGNVYDNFMNNMSYLSKVTQVNYIFAIKKFMQYLKVERIETFFLQIQIQITLLLMQTSG